MLIYNGFDVNRFAPGPAPQASERARVKVIGHIARFHPAKDHENFIAAVSILSRRRSDFQVIMVGKDVSKENDAIGSLLTRHAPSVEVALRGPLLDVRPIYSQLDALVVSSAWGESFPIVIGEAMSSGVPCIATDVGDSATLVGETGYIVPPRNPDALADAIEKIFDEAGPEKAERRQRCRERIVTRFSIDGIAEKFETLARG